MKDAHQARTEWTPPKMVNYGDVEALTAKGAGSGDGLSMRGTLTASQGDDNGNDFS